MSIGVNTATSPSAVLVESHEPPMPTSSTSTSIGASANATNASTVSSSKNVSGASSGSASSASTKSTNGAISSHASAIAASATGSPSIMMRSVKRSRCGLVNRPVRRPCARTRLSMMRLVEVLPFVPVTCTTRYVRCGSSSSSSTRRVRSTRGCTQRSPCRSSSAAYTASARLRSLMRMPRPSSRDDREVARVGERALRELGRVVRVAVGDRRPGAWRSASVTAYSTREGLARHVGDVERRCDGVAVGGRV